MVVNLINRERFANRAKKKAPSWVLEAKETTNVDRVDSTYIFFIRKDIVDRAKAAGCEQ